MGKVICAGLGPGDPDLMSVKSDRIIRGAKHLAFFRKKGRAGQARSIVNDMLRADVIEYPMEYPVTTELRFDSDEYRSLMVDFYAEWADKLEALAHDHDVVVLCEGDPFFYGSFMHLHTRLQGRAEVEVRTEILHQRLATVALADVDQLLGDLAKRLVPADLLPLALTTLAGSLQRYRQAARAVHHLGVTGTLLATARVEVGHARFRRFVVRRLLLANDDAVLHVEVPVARAAAVDPPV